jgi:hypothetical protein
MVDERGRDYIGDANNKINNNNNNKLVKLGTDCCVNTIINKKSQRIMINGAKQSKLKFCFR